MTHNELKEVLHYEPDTGKFYWKNRSMKWFTAERFMKSWNTRYAGGEAGSVATIDGNRYIKIALKALGEKSILANRLAWFYSYGVWPEYEIIHKNYIDTDNRLCNLCDMSRTNINISHIRREPNTSGTLGVSFDTSRNRWASHIQHLGKQYNLGRYKIKKDAITARLAAEKDMFGEVI